MASTGFAARARMVTVTIDPTFEYKFDPNPFHISKDFGDQVRWATRDPNASFEVDFEDSPFERAHFDNSHNCSGPLRKEVQGDKTHVYKYTVKVNGKTLDPGGIIDP